MSQINVTNKSDLRVEIENIKNSNASRAKKYEALVKLGISANEANYVLGQLPTRERIAFTFGVEIECYNLPYSIGVAFLRSQGLTAEAQSYNHRDSRTLFKLTSDSSLNGNDTAECVTPILGGKKGFGSLKKCCTALNNAGARVNRSTGLHVHIGVKNMTDAQYVNTFKNYQFLERLIDTFMAQSRRGNNSHWCASIRRFYFGSSTSKHDISRIMPSRYYKVNPCAWYAHRTIEFRQHGGTTDFDKISNWVNFCGKLVCWSKDNVLNREITDINDVPFLNSEEKAFFANRIAALN